MALSRSRYLRVLVACLILCFLSLTAIAQNDPDPNSPAPVLVAISGTDRAAVESGDAARPDLNVKEPRAFSPGSNVSIFVQNVVLMPGEGANAFRVYAEDARGRKYKFPVIGMEEVKGLVKTYRLAVQLRDEIDYWGEPQAGDVLIRVTWRGLTTDRLRLGYGETGGSIKSDTVPYSRMLAGVAPIENSKAGIAGTLARPGAVGYKWEGDRVRFLEQASFGPSPVQEFRLRRIGLRSWLADQFTQPYPSADNPYPNHPLKPSTPPADCDNEQTVTPDVPATCYRDTYTMYPIQTWHMKEALYGDAQLRHRVSWALSQIWVTSGVDIQQSRHMVEYYKVLANNAFGNYRTLMKEMTLNPTMGEYLDMARSTRNNPNENYAREIMQLFSIGLFQLNQDGTYILDGSGNPIPTYDQDEVNNLTKVLTGWRFCNTVGTCPNAVLGAVNYIDPLVLNLGVTSVNGQYHDLKAKTLLSYPGSTTTEIAACTNCTTLPNIATYANSSMDQALDNIFYHPSLPPYISRILIQQMVTSDPSPAYVSRVAGVFINNGSGVRGDMKAVVTAILLDPEARGDVKTDPNFGKLREPVLLATNFLRQFDVRGAEGTGQADGYLIGRGEYTGMGQQPFRSPTVFNYYPPGYVIPGTTLLGPEFALMTTGTAIQRTNFINRFTFTAKPVAVSLPNSPTGFSVDFSDLQALAASDPSGGSLLFALDKRLMHGTMSTQMRNTILPVVTSVSLSSPPTSAQTLSRVQQAVYLVATSSQYQVQR